MGNKSVYKIRDSVDLFLSNDQYLMAYYMNSRRRKSFKINRDMVALLESIDGQRTVNELTHLMEDQNNISPEETVQILMKLKDNRIITEVVSNNDLLSEEDKIRYSRQINYFSEFLGGDLDGILAQKKLLETHITVFGCGAVGGNIAIQLAMAGVGHLTLYDCDIIEPSDVARHMYYKSSQIGHKKVDALAQELYLVNKSITVDTIADFMRPETEITELIKKSDFVVNTLDEPYIGYTAAKISRVCMQYNIPHYIAGGFDAHLASTGEIIVPYITPCVECYANHFKISLKNWKPKKHPVIQRYLEIGGLPSMTLFSSSYACIEILKYLTGITEIQKDYKVRGEFLFTDMSLQYLDVQRDPNCPVCGGQNESKS